MNIALFGYGKMGRMIEQIALERGHQIAGRIDVDTQHIDYEKMDVAIDFSTPEAAFSNITNCLKKRVPVISGTTGWLRDYDKAAKICEKEGGAFIYSSNFSLGVNVFFELNAYLAKMMKSLSQYRVEIEEIHHTQKLDAPSGTAISLADGIIAESGYSNWKLGPAADNEIPINSIREGDVAGTHTVTYRSEIDNLQIRHEAHGRRGFAMGAVVAAEWIMGKRGIFTMKDVLDIGK